MGTWIRGSLGFLNRFGCHPKGCHQFIYHKREKNQQKYIKIQRHKNVKVKIARLGLTWTKRRGGGSNFEVGANIGTELVNSSRPGAPCITHRRRPANFKYDKQQLVNNLFTSCTNKHFSRDLLALSLWYWFESIGRGIYKHFK